MNHTISSAKGGLNRDELSQVKNYNMVSTDDLNPAWLTEQTSLLSQAVGFKNFLPESKQEQEQWLEYLDIMKKLSLEPDALEGEMMEKYPQLAQMEVQPHRQLYLVFLQLLKQPRRQFQNLTRRHRDFYYKEVLKFQNRGAIPDSVYLGFTLENSVESVTLEKGTQLTTVAGGDKQPLVYALTEALEVNQARVTQIRYIAAGSPHVLLLDDTPNATPGAGLVLPAPGETSKPISDDLETSYSMSVLYLSSPLLRMQEGRRTITINTQERAGSFENLESLELSTEKGWQQIDPFGDKNPGPTGYEIHPGGRMLITLDEFFPAVTAFRKNNGAAFENPVLKFTPQGQKRLDLTRARIGVGVEGLSKLCLENQEGKISANASFQLFGFEPLTGAFFRFSNPEITQKPLRRLSLSAKWIGGTIPNQGDYPDINNIYACYSAPTNPDALTRDTDYNETTGDYITTFETALTVRYTNGRALPNGKPQKLFSPFQFEINAPLQKESEKIESYQLNFTAGDFLYRHYITAQNLQARYQSHVTTNEYLIGVYGSEISTLSIHNPEENKERLNHLKEEIESLKKRNETLKTKMGTVYSPYTPTLESVSLNYTTHEKSTSFQFFNEAGDLVESGETSRHKNPQLVFRLAPASIPEDSGSQKISLLLVLNSVESLSATSPQKRVSRRYDGYEPLKLTFQYYNREKQWKNIEPSIPGGRQNPDHNTWLGVFALPSDIEISGDDQGCLLKATIQNTEAYQNLQLSGAYTQAVSATRELNGPQSRVGLDSPLPPMSIQKFVVKNRDIRNVIQPLPSFGGRHEQTDKELFAQASLRLHHRQRAITPPDYEALVLEKFPSIQEASCKNATALRHPGHLVIEVIPKARHSEPGKETHLPLADIALLQEIQEYIKQLSSPLVKVCVSNPDYNPVALDIQVEFKENQGGEAERELHQEITRELTKQLLGPQKVPSFSRRLDLHALWLALEKKPCVKEIIELSTLPTVDDPAEASLYVHIPATEHTINSKKRGHYES